MCDTFVLCVQAKMIVKMRGKPLQHTVLITRFIASTRTTCLRSVEITPSAKKNVCVECKQKCFALGLIKENNSEHYSTARYHCGPIKK